MSPSYIQEHSSEERRRPPFFVRPRDFRWHRSAVLSTIYATAMVERL